MEIGLPKVDVIFKGLANTAVVRNGMGIACLIIKDNTGMDTLGLHLLIFSLAVAPFNISISILNTLFI